MAFFRKTATPIIEEATPNPRGVNPSPVTHKEDAAMLATTFARPRLPSTPKKLTPRIDSNVLDEAAIIEYRNVAAEIGLPAQDMLVEEFRLFLAEHDIPTFNLQEVVRYMDEITAKDNPTGLGWHWCPVRERDTAPHLTFGRPSKDERGRFSDPALGKLTSSSDFYESHNFQHITRMQRGEGGHWQEPIDWRRYQSAAYSRTLPLHALKKIALVEREFGAGKAVFLVTDYTTAPHIIINPDPFLMAVIPNSAVAHGKGRFIIDVWDEPGFGIDRMVK